MVSKKLFISDKKKYEKYYKLMQNYEPINKYIKEEQLSKDTKYKYYGDLSAYCCSQDMFIDLLIEEALEEEKTNKPMDERKICERLDNFKLFLEEENYSGKSIERRLKTVRSVYRRNDVTPPEDDKRKLINPKLRETIKNSDIFQRFKEDINLSNDSTIGGYLTSLTGYCDYYNMSLEELIQEAEDEEESGVRIQKRKLKKRLTEYRNHLYTKYANSTVGTKMTDIVYFYVVNDIEMPRLHKPNEKYEPELSFKEIPTISNVRRALETTPNMRNRALFLFMMCSGSARAETLSMTIKEYMAGTEEYHHEKKDIKRALEKMDGKKDIIPVFHIVREKKKKDYYTCITPECNQYIINYLKTRDKLSLEDKLFDITKKGVTQAFQYVNDTNNWGWVKNNRQRFFTSHQLRRLNANIIDNERLVNMIQGRKFDETTRAYFKQDPKKVKNIYLKYIPKLTVYEKFKTNYLTDENYNKMAQELKEKDEKIAQLEKDIEMIRTDVNTDMEERLKKFEKLMGSISTNFKIVPTRINEDKSE